MRAVEELPPEEVLSEHIYERYEDLFKFLPSRVQALIRDLPAELHEIEEHDLLMMCRPTEIEEYLKLNLWNLVAEYRDKGKPVVSAHIYKNVCSGKTYTAMINNPKKLAWLIRPVFSADLQLKKLHQLAMTRMTEVMQLPFKNKKGETDHRAVNAFIKVFDVLDKRVMGQAAFTLRHEGKVLHDHGVKAQEKTHDPGQIDAMRSKIKELESARKQDIIDVTVESAKNSTE